MAERGKGESVELDRRKLIVSGAAVLCALAGRDLRALEPDDRGLGRFLETLFPDRERRLPRPENEFSHNPGYAKEVALSYHGVGIEWELLRAELFWSWLGEGASRHAEQTLTLLLQDAERNPRLYLGDWGVDGLIDEGFAVIGSGGRMKEIYHCPRTRAMANMGPFFRYQYENIIDAVLKQYRR